MKFIASAGLFTCLLSASLFADAQQPVDDTLNIRGVEVTGQKTPPGRNSAFPMQQVDIKTLKSMAGSTAADVLRNFSGVTIRDYGGLGGLKTVVVRSLGANHTGISIDGAPLSDAATGQLDLSKIQLGDLEAIGLTIGQGEQICQPARAQASASMISFHTVMPEFKESNLKFKAGVRTGSFGVISPYAGIYLKVRQRTTAGLSAGYNHTRGNYKYLLKNGNLPDTTLRRSNADMEAVQLNFRLETLCRDSSLLRIKTWFYNSERGLPGAVIFYNHHASQRLTNRDLAGNVQYSWQKGRKQLLTNLNFSNSNLIYRDPAYLNHEGGLDNHFHQQELYLSQAISFPVYGIFSMGAATDMMVNSLQTDVYSHGNPTRFSGLGSVSVQAKTPETEVTGVVLATLVNESTTEGKSDIHTAFSPSVSFITRISRTPLIRLRMLYKNSFRMPTFNDLYYNLVGNENLKPEFVNQFNLGVLLSEEAGILGFNFHADVYANRVKDKIVAVPTQNLFVWSMRNLGRVDILGLEAQAGVKAVFSASRELSINLNFTRQQALDMSDPRSSTYRQQIPYVPFQTFSGSLTVREQRISLGYNVLYNSHRYTLGENIHANLLPSWWVHDVAVSWQQSVKTVPVTLKAEVINLFNQQYEVIRGFPMNGRGFYISLNINY
ncbi:MAG: TonB-dependent receptor [Bacteroidales bacterium]|nr:TonB-dependent receptor [Bacteroidales bacterium]